MKAILRLRNVWNRLTVRRQIFVFLLSFLLVVEVVQLAIDTWMVERRAVEEMHTTTIEFALSVLPLLISTEVENRIAVAAELWTPSRGVHLHEDQYSQDYLSSYEEVHHHADEMAEALKAEGVRFDDIFLGQKNYRNSHGAKMREIDLAILPAGENEWISLHTYHVVSDIRTPLLITSILQFLVQLLILLAILFAVEIMLRPLKGLARNSELIAHGERPHDIIVERGGRDIRATIRNFNQMSKIIAQTFEYQRSLLMSLGHDLKGPLNHARELVDGQVSEPPKARILRSLDQAGSILSLVTEYTRATMRDGKVEIVEVSSLLQSLIEEAQDRGLSVAGDVEVEANIKAHYNALMRALRNLIENAAKYGGIVHVTLRVENSNVTIDIEDDGPGIEENMLEEVLLPFRRLSDDSSGTGLGLSIAHTLIVDNGGTLTLSNLAEGGLQARVVFAVHRVGGGGWNA